MTELLMAFQSAPPTLLGLGQHAWACRCESHQPRDAREVVDSQPLKLTVVIYGHDI